MEIITLKELAKKCGTQGKAAAIAGVHESAYSRLSCNGAILVGGVLYRPAAATPDADWAGLIAHAEKVNRELLESEK